MCDSTGAERGREARSGVGRIALACFSLASVAIAACSGNGDPSATPSPTTAPTPLPQDSAAALATFQRFVDTVSAGDLEGSWALYAASLPGTTEEHRADRGCTFNAFGSELPRMKHLFERTNPFEVVESFPIAGSTVVELQLEGAGGAKFLAVVVRVGPLEDYRVQYLNNGRTSLVPGVPDPGPSPNDPQGFCGIWTGPRGEQARGSE